MSQPAALLQTPEETALVLAELSAGERLRMLDNSRGWAWGYAGADGLVGYLPASALSA